MSIVRKWMRVPLMGRDGQVRAWAKVDSEDYERVRDEGAWSLSSNGYAKRQKIVDCAVTRQYMHRFVLSVPAGMSTDHINHDTLDNRRTNLRVCTHAQNMQNVRAGRGTSKCRGVSYTPRLRKWYAYGQVNGRTVALGHHDTEEIAAEVARAWRDAHLPYAVEKV